MSILTDMAPGLAGIDYKLLQFIHDHTIPGLIPALQFISASTTYVSISIALIVLVFALARNSVLLRNKFIALAMVLILVGLTSQGLKALIIRDRPFEKYPEFEKLSDAGGSSFPSGHTMEAFAMAASLSILFRRRWVLIASFFWALAVAYSRMTLGVHFPGDIAGGMAAGCFLGWIVPLLLQGFLIPKKDNSPPG